MVDPAEVPKGFRIRNFIASLTSDNIAPRVNISWTTINITHTAAERSIREANDNGSGSRIVRAVRTAETAAIATGIAAFRIRPGSTPSSRLRNGP